MSEKDKQKKKASAEETAAQETVEQTAAPAEEAVQEETFTVTKSQMEQMEQLAKVLADANDKYLRLAAEYDNYRKRTPAKRKTCTVRPKPTPSSRFWRCWTIWSGACSSLRRVTATGRGWR